MFPLLGCNDKFKYIHYYYNYNYYNMVQCLLNLPKDENSIIESFTKQWQCSKQDAILRIIREAKKK